MSTNEIIPLFAVATFISILAITTSNLNKTELEFVFLNTSTSPCQRRCEENATPMVCRYKFKIEWYSTMSKACYDCPYNKTDCDRSHCVPADGVKRAVTVVNRQLPGPNIEVCKGDRIIVDVINNLMGETTTMHWHGFHQRGTPYMDGVPYITQCPIQPGNTFRYSFHAHNEGTHFWHSHTGSQRADGVFGSFIVRVPESQNYHSKLYDYDKSEHVLIILDWTHEMGVEKFVAHYHSNGNNKPTTLLVNGKGRYKSFDESEIGTIYTPAARFNVEQGYRYRFRVINAGVLNCPIEVSIDNHTMTIISSDGNDIQPVQADSLVTFAGERFDFVLTANQTIDNYWIRFAGLMDCDERFTSAHQVAVLHYEGADDAEPEEEPQYENARRDGFQINPLNKPVSDNMSMTVTELNSINEYDIALKEKPDYTFYASYDFYPLDNPHNHLENMYGFYQVTDPKQQAYTPQINHMSFKHQPFPLLSDRDLIKPNTFCNSTPTECLTKYCECTRVLQVSLDSVIELILIDHGFTYDANHPFHLHGHAFRVIGMDKLGSNLTLEHFQDLDSRGLIKRNLKGAVLKDTVTVADGGYTIIRFHASNPGYWLFHCHIEFHVELGMAFVFKVGEHEHFPPVPRDFPKCRNWVPSEDSLGTDEFITNTTDDNEEIELTTKLSSFNTDINSTLHWWSYFVQPTTSSSTRIIFSSNLQFLTLFSIVRFCVL